MFLLIADCSALWHAINSPYFDGSIISSIAEQFRPPPVERTAIPGPGTTIFHVYWCYHTNLFWQTMGTRWFMGNNIHTCPVSPVHVAPAWTHHSLCLFQISFSIGLLLLTELLYRCWWVNGLTQPFPPDKNFGAWMDLLLMRQLSGGHWVAINALPTAAHTIWDVIAGQLLMSSNCEVSEKLKNSYSMGWV